MLPGRHSLFSRLPFFPSVTMHIAANRDASGYVNDKLAQMIKDIRSTLDHLVEADSPLSSDTSRAVSMFKALTLFAN